MTQEERNMRGKTVRSNRSVIRKLGLLVCAASIVGTLAGVARSQSSNVSSCFFNVTNTCVSNVTFPGSVGCCVQGAVNCLQNCLATCKSSKGALNAQCVQNCVGVFSFFQSDCIGRVTNTTIP
jgi:hypothetical protein